MLGILLGRACAITRDATSAPDDMVDLSHGILAAKLSEVCKAAKKLDLK